MKEARHRPDQQRALHRQTGLEPPALRQEPETGKRVSRINPPEEWIVTEVPELRIVDDTLWKAVKERKGEIAEKHATVIKATQAARAPARAGAGFAMRPVVPGVVAVPLEVPTPALRRRAVLPIDATIAAASRRRRNWRIRAGPSLPDMCSRTAEQGTNRRLRSPVTARRRMAPFVITCGTAASLTGRNANPMAGIQSLSIWHAARPNDINLLADVRRRAHGDDQCAAA